MTKTVLITGTSSGIGRASVEAFARAGWNVAATMRTPKPELYAGHANVRVYQLDVTDEASVAAAFQSVAADFGTIDVVVNNAGYGVDGVFEAMSDDVIRRQYETNVFGLMRVTRHAIEHMRNHGGGTIVQVSSMGGRLAFPLFSIYHGTKWAVEGFSESLRYELRQFNIRMKIVEPGVIHTEFYGTSREFVRPQGEPAYDAFIDKVAAVSQGAGKRGESANKVARVVVKAANSTSGKLRYVVGRPAPLLLVLRRLLPDRLFGLLVRAAYKL